MGFIGLFKQYNYIDSGKKTRRVIPGYRESMSQDTRGAGRTVALVGLASHGDTWHPHAKCCLLYTSVLSLPRERPRGRILYTLTIKRSQGIKILTKLCRAVKVQEIWSLIHV